MTRRIAAVVAAAAFSVPMAASFAPAAEAGSLYYSSCTKLARDYKHGVAKSAAAAQRQVRQGYGRPAYGTRAKKVYWENYKRLDRDRDGTACER
jgi:hypothetical protein